MRRLLHCLPIMVNMTSAHAFVVVVLLFARLENTACRDIPVPVYDSGSSASRGHVVVGSGEQVPTGGDTLTTWQLDDGYGNVGVTSHTVTIYEDDEDNLVDTSVVDSSGAVDYSGTAGHGSDASKETAKQGSHPSSSLLGTVLPPDAKATSKWGSGMRYDHQKTSEDGTAASRVDAGGHELPESEKMSKRSTETQQAHPMKTVVEAPGGAVAKNAARRQDPVHSRHPDHDAVAHTESGKSRVSTNFKVILIVAAAVVVACIALVVSAPFKRRVSAQRRRRNQFLSDSSASHGPTVDRKICSEQAQCPVRSDTSYCRRDVEAWLEATQMNDLSTHRDVIDRSSQLTLMPWQHRLHLVVPPHYPGENAVAGTPSQACDYEILI